MSVIALKTSDALFHFHFFTCLNYFQVVSYANYFCLIQNDASNFGISG